MDFEERAIDFEERARGPGTRKPRPRAARL